MSRGGHGRRRKGSRKPNNGNSDRRPALMLPLPRTLGELLDDGTPARPEPDDNLGLWLDKFVRRKSGDWKLAAEARVEEFERLLRGAKAWPAVAAGETLARLEAACPEVYGAGRYWTGVFRVEGRLLVDYGRASATEASVSMHPVLGCPRIPGSALKGALREGLRREWKNEPARMRELLGNEPGDDEARRGRLVLHDALPEHEFRLAVDVLTAHARGYYEGTRAPPADWIEPVPHTFLTVVETRFRVTMGLLPPARADQREGELLDEVANVLGRVLRLEGVGAKRSAGYGRLVPM